MDIAASALDFVIIVFTGRDAEDVGAAARKLVIRRHVYYFLIKLTLHVV